LSAAAHAGLYCACGFLAVSLFVTGAVFELPPTSLFSGFTAVFSVAAAARMATACFFSTVAHSEIFGVPISHPPVQVETPDAAESYAAHIESDFPLSRANSARRRSVRSPRPWAAPELRRTRSLPSPPPRR